MPKVKSKLIAVNHLRLTISHYIFNIILVIYLILSPKNIVGFCPTSKMEATDFYETFMPTCQHGTPS
jgi:hypothetical protein